MKLALITPRYGAEIGSGPEHACRLFAERMARRHDVDVLTTCARNPRAWRNDLSEGADRVRGVMVRRFAVRQTRDATADATSQPLDFASVRGRAEQLAWTGRRGPRSPSLIDHLASQCRTYDALVFFGLQHPLTTEGFALAPARTVVFPYLRPDRSLRFGLWREVLGAVRAVGYFSESERRLARRYIGAEPAHEDVIGIGIPSPAPFSYPRHQQDPADDAPEDDEFPAPSEEEDAEAEYLSGRGIAFRRQHRLYGPLATYAGRADQDNGFEELFEYFETYAAASGDAALGLFGAKMMKVPGAPFVRLAGVLPDRQRMAAFEASEVALVPSSDDLLAQSLVESLAVGTPVLASARNAAAVEHCRASNGGLFYANREEFVDALRLLMGDTELRAALGENGREYTRKTCRWDVVLPRFERLLDAGGRSRPHR